MRRLHLFLAVLALAFLAACANTPTVNSAAKKAYETIDAYVLLVENRIDRGISSKAQAQKQLDEAKKARATVQEYAALLATCKPPAPCEAGSLLNSVQPLLLEYERQLREDQKAKDAAK